MAEFSIEKRKVNQECIFLGCVFFLLTLLQFLAASQLQFSPIYDMGSVFYSAIELATTGEIENIYYFARFGNNWPILRFIAAIFSISRHFTGNYFMVYAAVLVVIVNVGVYAFYDLVKMKSSRKTAVIMLCVIMLYTPIYIFPSLIYTDVASMAMPIVALNLFYRIIDANGHPKKMVVLSVLLGLVVGLGALFKITAMIVFIAMVMLAWIFKERKRLYMGLGISTVVIAVLLSLVQLDYRNHVTEELLERWETPWFQWTVMGLREEGLRDNMWSGTDVGYFYNQTHSMETRQEREEFLLEELRASVEGRGAADWLRLFAKKYIVLHYRGDFGPGATIYFAEMQTPFGLWFRDVRFEPVYIAYHRAILYSIFLLAYISIFFKNRDYVAFLTLIGIYIFFIGLSEVRVRLLTNQFFIFFYLASISIHSIIGHIQRQFNSEAKKLEVRGQK